jgi:Tol biopolymer transport system component
MKDGRGATRSGGHQAAAAVSPYTGSADGRLLLALTFAAAALLTGVSANAQLHPAVIDLLSQTARGFSAEGRSEAPIVNLNGLVSAYSSDALDLVSPPFQNSVNQVYARELELVTSELVSKGAGRGGNRGSQTSGFPPGISGDGRYVAFSSSASNLVPEELNGLENIFVYDRELGATELITRGVSGPADGTSSLPKISGDGRYVVFQSIASNLVAGDDNGLSDIFLFDRTGHVMMRVTSAPDGTPSNGGSITANISYDGHFVAYASRATNLVPDATTGTFEQIFVTDWQNHITQLVSVSSDGTPGNAISFLPSLSTDGSQVAFKSEAFNLVPGDTNGVPDVFVRDRTTGTTQRVSVDDFGNQANGLSGGPGISGDGRFVAFPSFSSNLVPEDGNGFSDFPVTMSTDGRWIGFASAASNLVANDLNNDLDAFLACNPFDEFDCAPPTATPTPTNTPGMKACVGDCNGDGSVTIDDLIRMVNIALGIQSICPVGGEGGCAAGDANCDCEITVDEIIRAVQNSLRGCVDFGDCTIEQEQQMCCEEPPITRTATATRTVTPTPPVTPTATPTQPGAMVCVGDCNGTGTVTIDELIRMVNIALDVQSVCPGPQGNGCLAGDSTCDCMITVDEIIQAVNNALAGCGIFNMCPEIEHQEMCCGQ